MKIEEQIPLLEEIFSEWKETIGDEYQGYRNHVYRDIHFCFYLRECNDEEREKIIIAAAFHDIGIWIEDTVNYIPPSIPPAREYLKKRGLESWSEEIEQIIIEHHKIQVYKNDSYPLVELYRKADLVDFSLGLFKFEINQAYIKKVNATFPNFGFHRSLARRAVKWILIHPLDPVPMMKW